MLGYLPLRFTPSGDVPNRKAVLKWAPTSPNLVPQVESAGSSPGLPPGPHLPAGPMVSRPAQRRYHGSSDAVRNRRGLGSYGEAGPLVWHALLRAIAERQMDTSPYNYVIVAESLPETLAVWQDGRVVFKSFTNTGVPGAPTPQGTWPVAYKQNPNLMKGCDPNGPRHSVWVAYASYFLPSVGDAIHAYPRPGYGYPQSNGCVEVPPWQGATVYAYDPVGTLVTVTS